MSKLLEPAYADPFGTVAKNFAGERIMCSVALGTATPNNTTIFNVANGNGIGIGCLLFNKTGRRANALWLYSPLDGAGADQGSGLRWVNIA